jgi:Tfp pilus assembly protein PilZ
VSVGGVYLVLAIPIRRGEVARLKFSLPGEKGAISCDGRVVWVNPPSKTPGCGAAASHLPPGYGLEFGHVEAGDRTRIDALVRSRPAEVP